MQNAISDFGKRSEPAQAPETPRNPPFLLPRIWRNGLAELVWPILSSDVDAACAFERGMGVAFVYALIAWCAHVLSGRPWAGIVMLVFYLSAGLALKTGSYFGALAISVFAGIAFFASLMFHGWSFRAGCIAASPLLLSGWWKAKRYHPANLSGIGWNARISLLFGCGVLGLLALSNVLSLPVFSSYRLNSDPMEPSLYAGDTIVSIASPVMGKIHRGALVFVRYQGPARVVGLSGDHIQVVSGKLVRNGSPVLEPYVKRRYPGDQTGWRWHPPALDPGFFVPANSYFVLNDNRNNPWDSRAFGPIPDDQIEGRPILAIRASGGSGPWLRWLW